MTRLESDTLHQLKNQIGIAVGFVDLLLDEMPADDARRGDLLHVQQAIRKALDILPRIQEELDTTQGPATS
ncbi:MAG: hypothetical protein AB7K63_04745 [Vicinamibacterales bacterium]